MSTTRHTPRLDKLIDQLAATLEPYGAKSTLARVLAREAGIELQTAKNRLTGILARRILPNGEDTLILAEWLAHRTPQHPYITAGK